MYDEVMVEPRRETVRELAVATMRLSETIRRGRDQAVDPVRLALLQTAALNGPIRPSAVAAGIGVNASSVTRRLQVLEDAGLVSTVADPADRRACLIEATPAGWTELSRLQEVGVDAFCQVVADWSPEDVEAASAVINRLADSLVTHHERQRVTPHRRRRNARPQSAEERSRDSA